MNKILKAAFLEEMRKAITFRINEGETFILSFDGDGLGAQAAVQIATLTGAPDLNAQDFIFV